MKKLKYSPDAREKLKQHVMLKFEVDIANKAIKEMKKSFRDL